MLYEYRAKVSRVVDGDTIDLEWIDLGFGMTMKPTLGTPLRMRFAYCNAFETSLRGKTTPEQKALGLQGKAWLKSQIEGGVVRIRTESTNAKGSFGRWLAWVWDDEPDTCDFDERASYNHRIIELGYGVPYGE